MNTTQTAHHSPDGPMADLTVHYRQGTWRMCSPEDTLARITPHLPTCGITRCADVTHLDKFGVPVYCAIRPTAAVLQVSNGKGLTHVGAKVSALMEAIEFFHAEQPLPSQLHTCSMRVLHERGQAFVHPADLVGFLQERYCADTYAMEWVQAQNLISGEWVCIPSGVVFFHRVPALHTTTTNGLASGNHIVEATLHALYELIERDAAATLLGQQRIPIKHSCKVVDLQSVQGSDDPDLADLQRLIHHVQQSGSKLVLLRVKSVVSVHTFWAIVLNEQSWISGSTFNTGWGTHLNPSIAATRAVTEAIQSRVTMIHGAREDALIKPVFRHAQEVWGSKAFQFFMNLAADAAWADLSEDTHDMAMGTEKNLQHTLNHLLGELVKAGHTHILRCDLTRPDVQIPVVRLIAPSLRLRV